MLSLAFSLLGILLIGRLFEAVAASPILSRDGTLPTLPFDPNTSKYCSWWVDVAVATSCPTLLEENAITLDNFRRWNPSITSDCGNLIVERSYCVEALDEPATAPTTSPAQTTSPSTSTTPRPGVSTTSTTTSLSPTTTKPSNGIETPSPAQPSIVSNCDKFYLVKIGDTCDTIANAQGISPAQFLAWNPSAGSSCTGLWADAYACVSIIGHTPTPANPGNGIATPTPILPKMVNNCDSFYKVKSGDTCDIIASKNGISVSQITTWNPNAGSGCTGLWLDYYICISIIGHTPTPTNPGNGISTPSPIQSGMTKSCKTFHFVKTGENCATIVARYKITLANFVKWNPAVGSTSCTGLWANTYACVAVL